MRAVGKRRRVQGVIALIGRGAKAGGLISRCQVDVNADVSAVGNAAKKQFCRASQRVVRLRISHVDGIDHDLRVRRLRSEKCRRDNHKRRRQSHRAPETLGLQWRNQTKITTKSTAHRVLLLKSTSDSNRHQNRQKSRDTESLSRIFLINLLHDSKLRSGVRKKKRVISSESANEVGKSFDVAKRQDFSTSVEMTHSQTSARGLRS